MTADHFQMQLDQLAEGQTQHGQLLRKIADDQNTIITALVGNKLGTKGVIPRQDELEARANEQDRKLSEIDRRFVRWGGVIAGVAFALGFLKEAIAAYFKGN